MNTQITVNSSIWRKSSQGAVAGVCQGLAEGLNVPVGVLRLAFLVSVFVSFGTTLMLYLAMAIALPTRGQITQDKLLGVCRRLSERTKMDVGLVRVITLIFFVGSMGLATLFYFVGHLLLSETQTNEERYDVI